MADATEQLQRHNRIVQRLRWLAEGQAIDVAQFSEDVRAVLRCLAEVQPPEQTDAKDALRYRWLRDVGDSTWQALGTRIGVYRPELIDQRIDAAIATMKEPT